MAEKCPWVDRVIGESGLLDAEVEDHVASCDECGDESLAHEALLGTFRGIGRPALSPHFHRQVMAGVENERRRERVARRRQIIMRMYWFAATVVCAAVLANLRLSPLVALQQEVVLFAVVAFLAPVATLLFVIRINPLELILQTMGRNVSG